MRSIKVCLADDHKFAAEAGATFIRGLPFVESCYTVSNGLELMKSIPENKPDLVLLDIGMPLMNGIEAARQLVDNYPDVLIMMLSAHHDTHTIVDLLQIGVQGYVTKDIDMEELRKALEQIVNVGYFFNSTTTKVLADYIKFENKVKTSSQPITLNLTEREIQIATLMCMDLETQEIAEKLDISAKTIQAHKQNIYNKTETKGLISLYKVLGQAGIVGH